MRLDAIELQVEAPKPGIHRADLLRWLSGRVDRASIHVQAHCVSFRAEHEHVIAHFADGHELQADKLVVADGLYSMIREQLLGKAPPRYIGSNCWRGLPSSRTGTSPGHFSETGGEVWYATLGLTGRRTGPRMGMEGAVLPTPWGWWERIGHLIEATEEETILRNDLVDRKPCDTQDVAR